MEQHTNNNFIKRPNGIPDSWNIEATKNNFVLNTSNIKDINKIENDIKNAEINKIISFKSKYVPESWNLFATTNIQTSNISQIDDNQQQHKNKKHKNYSSTHENMLNILHYNKIRNQAQQQQQQQQNIRIQKIESYVKRKTKQIGQTYPMKEHDLLTNTAKQIFKPVSSGLGVLERIKQKKEERAKQKAQTQPTQQFIE